MRIPVSFSRPTRVSRLYPIFTLVLMLVSSSLVYAWQEVQIRSDSAVVSRDSQIAQLKGQVDSLTSEQKTDKATLQIQTQKLSDTTTQLTTLQKQLDSKNADLTSTEQQLSIAQQKLQQQTQQLSDTASQLAQLRSRPPLFSFQNKSALLDVPQKEAEIKQVVTDAYTYIQALYGQPYLLNQVTITFVNQFTIPGASGEIVITNGSNGISIDIHLKNFDPTDFQDNNTIIHEMVHAFHGVSVIDPSAIEEGMAVAATDAVMAKMTADGKLPDFGTLYVNITDAQYTQYNQDLSVYKDDATFYQDPKISLVYQLIGKAWYQLYLADPTIFLDFNNAYYALFQKGQTIDVAGIQNIIRSLVKTVKGVPIDTYLSTNRAFNPS